jgi:Capsular polysaccharide biosynthesis protein
MDQERYLELEEQMNLKEMWYMIKKRIVLIILLPVLCAAAAGCISFFVLDPVYEANVSIIISKGQGDMMTQSDVLMYQNLIKTYTEIAKSNVVAEEASSLMEGRFSAQALQGSLTVTSQTGTQVLNMTSSGSQPQEAADKVEALAKAFLQESKRLLPSGSIEIMDHAKLPIGPSKPNKMMNIAIAFFLGLMAAIGFALLIEYMKDTIKSEEDVDRYLGIPVIGVIPKHA